MFKPSDTSAHNSDSVETFETASKDNVYIREVETHELGDLIKLGDLEVNDDFLQQKLYAVFDETGQRIAITNDRLSAFSFAKMHDYVPASVH
jgi:hypothetical protein